MSIRFQTLASTQPRTSLPKLQPSASAAAYKVHDITVPASKSGFQARGQTAVIAKKIYRKGDHSCPKGYKFAWHGTKEKHVLSILKTGIKASGERLDDGTQVKPPDNHYSLGMKFDGIENWAAAVFVSPSVTYASHVCYAGRTLLQAPAVAEESGGMWAVVMELAVREGSYTTHEQTVLEYDEMPGEPECISERLKFVTWATLKFQRTC